MSGVVHFDHLLMGVRRFAAAALRWAVVWAGFWAGGAAATEHYATGFTSFSTGNDALVGTDGWTGSHAGLGLHAVLAENQHGVAGIGQAAALGGLAAVVPSTSRSVFVRRLVVVDPVGLGEEVMGFGVVFGIKDSTAAGGFRRDTFEFLVYNTNNQLLGGVQFDNATLNTVTGQPQRLIFRLVWTGSAFEYQHTGYSFLPETLEALAYRINFRTNRWTVSLGGIPIIDNLPFYSGPSAATLGSVVALMRVSNVQAATGNIHPGDNYLLFDDYLIATEGLSDQLAIGRTAQNAPQLTWIGEAGYRYQVAYSADGRTWRTDLAGSGPMAGVTGGMAFADPTRLLPSARWYRLQRTFP